MIDPRIVVFPRGQLDSKQRERLTKTGIIAIEVDDPDKVTILEKPTKLVCSNVVGDDLVQSALLALSKSPPTSNSNDGDRQRFAFISTLAEAVSGASK